MTQTTRRRLWPRTGRAAAASVALALVVGACGSGEAPSPASPPAVLGVTAAPDVTRSQDPSPTPTPFVTQAPPSMPPAGTFALDVADAGAQPSLLSAIHAQGLRYLEPGTLALASPSLNCQDCDIASTSGFKLVLRMQATGAANGPSGPPPQPAAFDDRVHRSLNRWPAALVIVEDDMDDAASYAGTPAQYLAELSIVCFQAHATAVGCADGGLSQRRLVELVAAGKLAAGDASGALKYAAGEMNVTSLGALQGLLTTDAPALDRARTLLGGLRKAGADFVDLHWVGLDPAGLPDAAAFLRAASGLPVVAGRVGLTTTDQPSAARLAAQLKALRLPLAVWESIDGARDGARALFDEGGAARPSGRAFEAALRSP